jgi:predicted acylesterase/phospholipase RssA
MSSEVQNSKETEQEQQPRLLPSSSTLTRSKQRVLVLQGGGALGAYEAGAFRAFYDWLYMQTDDDANIFDVIAGTSIGAINASIIISHVIENARKAKKEGEGKGAGKLVKKTAGKEQLTSWMNFG